jgi:hypothetical protein
MNKLQLHLLAFVFAAFLPPKSKPDDSSSKDESTEESDYYKVLGLQKSCTQEEIRKAYKKKSLQYHPDKVAQFANTNRYKNKTHEEIQADFVRIKEAYEILSIVQKRNAYDVLGLEGSQFLASYIDKDTPMSIDPAQIAFNLASASFVDKTKLFMLVLLFISMLLLGPILVCIKVDSAYNGNVGALADVNWVFVLIPIWVLSGIYLVLSAISQAWVLILQTISIIVLEVFLALKWDGVLSWDYALVLIPLYVHQSLFLIQAMAAISKTKRDVARMVTISYLEEKILPTFRMDDIDEPEISVPDDQANSTSQKRRYKDLSEEEIEYLNELYIIVDTDEDGVFDEEEKKADSGHGGLDPEIKVLFDIAESYAFKVCSEQMKMLKARVVTVFLTRIPFLVLLTLQLDLDKGWDWNLVFCTVWIDVCFHTLSDCFICCCSSASPSPQDELIYDNVESNDVEVTNIDVPDVDFDEEMGRKDATVKTSNQSQQPMPSSVDVVNGTAENKDESNEGEAVFAPVSFSPLFKKDEDESEKNKPNLASNDEEAMGVNIDHDRNADDETDEGPDPFEVEIRTKATGRCCNNMISIILLALFLVKLNGAYDENDSRGSYSSVWIIFPLLFFAGLILTSCACCIYSGVNPEKLDGMMGRMNPNHNSDNKNTTANDNIPSNQDMPPEKNEDQLGAADADDDLD